METHVCCHVCDIFYVTAVFFSKPPLPRNIYLLPRKVKNARRECGKANTVNEISVADIYGEGPMQRQRRRGVSPEISRERECVSNLRGDDSTSVTLTRSRAFALSLRRRRPTSVSRFSGDFGIPGEWGSQNVGFGDFLKSFVDWFLSWSDQIFEYISRLWEWM